MVRESTLFNFDQLFESSYKGVRFYIQDPGTIRAGRKTVEHTYPDSDKRYFEDLGKRQRTFELDCIVSTLENSEEKNALKKVLDEKGAGLLVHPFDGDVNVQPTSYSLVNNYGTSVFSVIFEETSNAVFPIITKDNSDYIDNLKNELVEDQSNKFSEGIKTIFSGADGAEEQADKTADAVNEILESTRTVFSLTDSLSDIENDAFKILDDVYELVNIPNELALKFTNIFSNLEVIGNRAIDTFNVLKRLFKYGIDIELLTGTRARDEINENNRLTNNLINVNSLSIAYKVATEIEYENEIQLQEVRDALDDGYNSISENLNLDTLYSLKELRVSTNAVLDDIEQNVPKIFLLNILNQKNLEQIVYEHYGNFSNSDEFELQFSKILNLNPQISNTGKVVGEIKLLTIQ
jgi:prophage DNA circulation protein